MKCNEFVTKFPPDLNPHWLHSIRMLLASIFEKEQLAQKEVIQLKIPLRKTYPVGWTFCQMPVASEDN